MIEERLVSEGKSAEERLKMCASARKTESVAKAQRRVWNGDGKNLAVSAFPGNKS